MATTTTPRLGLTRWSAASDPWPARPGFDAEQALLDDLLAVTVQGTYAARPAAAIRGRFYWVTGTGTNAGKLYYDTGTAWLDVIPVGGGGPGGALAFGGIGVEGTSGRGARADHKHTVPAHDTGAHTGVDIAGLSGAPGQIVHRVDGGWNALATDPPPIGGLAWVTGTETLVMRLTSTTYRHVWSAGPDLVGSQFLDSTTVSTGKTLSTIAVPDLGPISYYLRFTAAATVKNGETGKGWDLRLLDLTAGGVVVARARFTAGTPERTVNLLAGRVGPIVGARSYGLNAARDVGGSPVTAIDFVAVGSVFRAEIA